jgi:hypothetical protein
VSRTKAEIYKELIDLRLEVATLYREIGDLNEEIDGLNAECEDRDYLSPDECTALEQHHRKEVWIYTRVADHEEKKGDLEGAKETREKIVEPHKEFAAHYALRAAERTVEWEDDEAADCDAAEDSP